MARKLKKIGEILVGWNLLSPSALEDALAYAAEHNRRIGEALIELELCKEEDVCKALAAQFDMPFVDLDKTTDLRDNLKLIPEKIIRERLVLPRGEENGRLKIIISDPLDLDTLDLLRFRVNPNIEVSLAPASKIRRFIDTFMSAVGGEIERTMDSIDQDMPEDEKAIGKAVGDDPDAPIIKLINQLIGEAVRMRASDIHVEPMADRVRVRYRVDGECTEREQVPKKLQGAVTARLKLMSGIDIAE